MAPPRKSLTTRISNAFLYRKKADKPAMSVPEVVGGVATIVRPTLDSEIERQYAAVLEDMALPESKRLEMIQSESVDRKWQLIQAHGSLVESQLSPPSQNTVDQSEEQLPAYWITKLSSSSDTPSLEDVQHIHVLLRTSHKRWLTSFLSEGGLVALQHTLSSRQNDTAFSTELVRCFKALMNTDVGMSYVLSDPCYIETLTCSIEYKKKPQELATVLEILSVVCWYSDAGHEIVLQAMDTYRRVHQERSRYASVVSAIENSIGNSGSTLPTTCLTFINTLISSCTVLEDRVAVRNDFLALDLLRICCKDSSRSDFQKQIEVFEGMMHADREDTVLNSINVSNLEEVLEYVLSDTLRFGFRDNLLHVLQSLLVIPSEISLGTSMWNLVEADLNRIVSTVANNDTLCNNEGIIDIETLQSLKEEVSVLENNVLQLNTMEDIVQRQKSKIEELEATLAFEKNEMKVRVENLENQLHHEQISAREATEDFQKKLEEQIQEREAVEKERLVIQAQLDKVTNDFETFRQNASEQSNVEESRTSNPEYAKYFKLKKMGMPLEQLKLKMRAEGLDPSVLEGADLKVEKEDPRASSPEYAKYFKLKKMGMPLEQLKLKMNAEGLDVSVLEAKEGVPSLPQPPSSNPEYAKYFKLKKMGMPLEQIQLKMKAEGLDPNVITKEKEQAASVPVTTVQDPRASSPEYAKYFKLKKMGMPLEQLELKMKTEGLDPNVLLLSSSSEKSINQPSSTSQSAIPTPPEYAKYVKLKKMGMPLAQLQLKMRAEGLDPSVLDQPTPEGGDSTITTSTTETINVVAAVVPKATVVVVPEPEKISMPAKPVIVPTVKMRGLYWKKLSDEVVHNSMWASMDDSHISLDIPSLEAEFGRETQNSSSSSRTSSSSEPPPVPKLPMKKSKAVVQLVDGKRQQNCSIALARFRMPFADIRKAILEMDETILSLERVSILQGLVPTLEEVDAVTSFEGDPSTLGVAERFIKEVSDIPRLAIRLKAIATCLSFKTRLDEFTSRAIILEDACTELKQCESIKRIMEVVLAVGNYLNGSTPRGAAWGFSLDDLSKLSQVKGTSKSKRSLMHFIVDTIQQQSERLSKNDAVFYSSLHHLESASVTSLSQLERDVKSLEGSLRAVSREVEKLSGAQEHEVFCRRITTSYLSSATSSIKEFQDRMTLLCNNFKDLTLSFGIDIESGGTAEEDHAMHFFGIWNNFVISFKKAASDIEKQQKAKSTIVVSPKVASKKKKSSDNRQDLFHQFSKSQEGDASAIVAEFRNRQRVGSKRENNLQVVDDSTQPECHNNNMMGKEVANELAAKLFQRRSKVTTTSNNNSTPTTAITNNCLE